jgi:hypothetical protein
MIAARHSFESMAADWPMWDEPLPVSPDATVGRCLVSLRGAEPWMTMPVDDLAGEFRPLATALINTACDSEGLRRLHIEGAAFEHGLFRRSQRVNRAAIGVEFAALRGAVRDAIEASPWPDWLRRATAAAIVAEIDLARMIAEHAFDHGVGGPRRTQVNWSR